MKRDFRKPLIVMTPKSLLRHKEAVSPVKDFTDGRFHEVLDDAAADASKVRRVVLLQRQGLLRPARKAHAARTPRTVAIVRVEQFYPLPRSRFATVLGRYRKAKDWVWVQEESQNMGGWTFMEPRLRALGYEFDYVGRDASASPATGSLRIHQREQDELVRRR